MHSMSRRVIAGLAVVLGSAVIAPAASATITPTVTLDQSTGTVAASTTNLGMDLKFAPSSNDSPKDLTLSLPAGLLANASIDGGACLKSATPVAACQVGTGTVTATENLPVPVSLSLPATFDLVAPPNPSDLAGLDVLVTDPTSGKPGVLGTPAAITVRPSSAPAGVGLNIAFTNIPDTYPVLGVTTPISVDAINSTFQNLHYPSSCPATPASFNVTADSYGAPTAQTTASAPLLVTGCSKLAYAPTFSVTAAKDQTDSGVQLVTDVKQKPGEATSRTVALALPTAVLGPNVAGVVNGAILCTDPTFATCKTIGTASSTSPLYPIPLAGQAYLTGALTAPAITIVFPAPFAITLSGPVDIATNTTTFGGVPDIPLTDLKVSLAGGPDAVFSTTCATPTGTATSTLTSQNGDLTAFASSTFTVSGCPPPTTGTGGGSGGGTTPPGKKTVPAVGVPALKSGSLSGLAGGKPTLSFRLVAGTNAPKLRSFTIKLPSGLRFVRRRVHKRLKIVGVSVTGATVKSLALKRGRLVVTLRRPAAGFVVKIGPKALSESSGLKSKAKHHRIKSLKLTVSATNANGKVTNLTLQI
jgi:hypothetical protein